MSIFSSIACVLGFSSEAREKAKKYAEVEKKLKEKLTTIKTNLDDVEEGLKLVDDTFVNGNGEAEGKIMTTFTNKEAIWSSQYQTIITEMRMGVTTLQLRIAEAVQRKEYWEMQAEIEEMKANG